MRQHATNVVVQTSVIPRVVAGDPSLLRHNTKLYQSKVETMNWVPDLRPVYSRVRETFFVRARDVHRSPDQIASLPREAQVGSNPDVRPLIANQRTKERAYAQLSPTSC